MERVSTNETIPGHGILVTGPVGKWIKRKVFGKRNIAKSEDAFSQLGLAQEFTLKDLELATNRFSANNVIGKGGFGVVYKGCLSSGNLVAVKTPNKYSTRAGGVLREEISVLGPLYHKNIVRFLGYCIEGSHSLLVHEYVGKGSLQDWLKGDKTRKSQLSWESRMKVLLGTAKAVTYLHEEIEPKVVHRDIKSANVLLDDEFNAKLCSFDCAILLAAGESPISTEIVGTMGYIDPEYLYSSHLTEKSDVYSFGIVLLETISGRSPIRIQFTDEEEVALVDWVKRMARNRQLEEVLDPNIRARPSTRALKRALLIALRCIDPVSTRRPTMSEVVRMLESEEYPIPKPFLVAASNSAPETAQPVVVLTSDAYKLGFFCSYAGTSGSNNSASYRPLPTRIGKNRALGNHTVRRPLCSAPPIRIYENLAHEWEEEYLNVEEFCSSDSEFSEPDFINSTDSPHAQEEITSKTPLKLMTRKNFQSEPGFFLEKPLESARGQRFLDDGYNWKRYGKKEINGVLMDYYKCTYPNCEVKRRCTLSSSDGHVEVTYKGNHHHSKSKTTRRSPSSPASAHENESMSDDSPGQSIVSRGILETDVVARKEELTPLVGIGQMSFKELPQDQLPGIKIEFLGKDKSETGASPEYDGRTKQHLEEAVSISQLDPLEFFASKMSIIHTLDLSHTSIKCLPEFISELVALRVLILRGCELLMELRPEIGELTNLEVLDLEGTEIICLSKEIAKLTNLRSLKFSFCGYADQFQETMRIGPIIPRKALSHLLQLNELSIDVIPDGDWWNSEVKTVIDDLGGLQKLRTLCLYLPTVDLLDNLIRQFIPRFRFTVGYDEERLISRLPQEVLKEFLDLVKFEKGLKYVNGEGIPIEIKKALKHTDVFLVERHWTIKNLLEFGPENIDGLKMCVLLECNELQTVVNSKQVKDFDGAILGSLEYLSIHYMKNMERIWRGPVVKGSLSNLKSLALHTCVSLTTIFTVDLLANLLNLEELRIEDCPKVETLVSSSSPDLVLRYFLPNLKNMLLIELPNLGCISSCLPVAPKLERLVIFYCPKLDRLSPVEISNRNLKVIKGEKLWWDALKWGESGLMEDGQGYLASKFIPLRKDEDLEEQFTSD